MDGQADLLEVVGALDAGGGRTHLLDGGQQQADQHGDDSDDDQQLDQRKAAAAPHESPPETKVLDLGQRYVQMVITMLGSDDKDGRARTGRSLKS